MLALMREADPTGHLLIRGKSPTEAQLAVLVGAPVEQVSALLIDLESAGVFSRTRKGVIYSRRMTRDEKKAQTARENGKLGGNPNIGKQTEIFSSDNPQDNHEDKPRARAASFSTDSNLSEEGRIDRDLNKHSANAKSADRFEDEFWPAYPHKVDKAHARAAFDKALRKTTIGEIIIALDRYKATKPPDRKWCNPATWLNGERWTDEPSPDDGATTNGKANGHHRASGERYDYSLPLQPSGPRSPAPRLIRDTH